MGIPALSVVLQTLCSLGSIKRAAKAVYDWAIGDEPEVKEAPVAKKSNRKKHDTSRLTKYQFDFIIEAHRQCTVRNETADKGCRITQKDLAAKINEKMGTHKSASTFALVWNGKVDRDTLADGKPYFDY